MLALCEPIELAVNCELDHVRMLAITRLIKLRWLEMIKSCIYSILATLRTSKGVLLKWPQWVNLYYNAYLGTFHSGLNTGVATFQESRLELTAP